MTERVAPRASIHDRLAAAGLPALPRRAWLEIDEQALAGNLAVVRELAGPGVELNAVVKADAYGHGLVPVARVFEAAGADRLCVASLDEALVLRGAGLQLPILVLFPIGVEQVSRAAQQRIEIVAAERETTRAALERLRPERDATAELMIHLEIETGLSRGGLKPEHAAAVAAEIVATPGARLTGVWSHLASPESAAASAAQVERFNRAVDALADAGVPVPARHMAATGGLFSGRGPVYEGVRVGLALYGLLPDDLPLSDDARELAARLRPAMALKCRPLRIEAFAPGTPVGYGGRWVAARPSRVATLPVGYGDGWARASSPSAAALVHGRRIPLIGTVAMDAVMADVTDIPEVGLDDEFVLIGEQGGTRIVTNEVARARTTIAWEVVTSMAHRLPRVYHAGSVLLGLRTLSGESRAQTGGLPE